MNTPIPGEKEVEMEQEGPPVRLKCVGCGQLTRHTAVLVVKYHITEFSKSEYLHYQAEEIPHHLGGWCPRCDHLIDLPVYGRLLEDEPRESPDGLYYDHVVSNIDESEVEYGSLLPLSQQK